MECYHLSCNDRQILLCVVMLLQDSMRIISVQVQQKLRRKQATDMDVGHSVLQGQQMTVMCTDSSATSILEERVPNGVCSRTRRVVALYTSLVHAQGTPSARGAETVLEPTTGSTISFSGSQKIRYSHYVGQGYCKSDEITIGYTADGNNIQAHGLASKSVLVALPPRGQYGVWS